MNKILIKIGASGITHSGYYPFVSEQNWNQNRGSDNINYSLIAASGYGNSLHYEQNLNQNLYQYQSFSDNRKWLH